jgi:serine/threonine-protein kinase 11
MLVGVTSLCKFTPLAQDVPHSPRRLKQVNQYLLQQKIGSGGSSHVFLAIDQRTEQRYAVKRVRLTELSRSPVGLAQLEREIRVMHAVVHPNILRLLEVLHVRSRGEVFLVLEYAANGSLGAHLQSGNFLSRPAIFSIVKQVAGALRYLHRSGYVHQDIKPYNILLDADGRAMLADFGVGHSFASAGMVVGSPAYQAPEALDDSYGSDEESLDEPQKEDVWSLGVTLYQLLFHELPFQGETLFEIVNDIKERSLEIPEDTDHEVGELLRGMLTVDPVGRIGVEEILASPVIAAAPDLAPDLPVVNPGEPRVGEVVELQADVCGEGYSFADVGLAARRRASYTARSRGKRPTAEEEARRRGSWDIACEPIWMGSP